MPKIRLIVLLVVLAGSATLLVARSWPGNSSRGSERRSTLVHVELDTIRGPITLFRPANQASSGGDVSGEAKDVKFEDAVTSASLNPVAASQPD